jgi:hypothetical protein
MYVEPLTLIWLASWLWSYFASFISFDRSAMDPCLAKSLTQAPSRPTTSDMVPDAAAAIVWSFVDANGALRSFTVIFGFAASNESIT